MQYRAGDILLPASGTFVADSGRSIFLEQSFEQRGLQRNFRWEIPYQYIVRLEEKNEPTEESGNSPKSGAAAVKTAEAVPATITLKAHKSANLETSGGAPAILPLQNRPKTA